MTSNSLRFLSAHNTIEEYLSRLVKPKEHLDFIALLNSAIDMGQKEVRYYQHDLRQFARLRNAIAHTLRKDKVIADPTDWTVGQIEKLVELITNPPKAHKIFGSQVVWVDADESVAVALDIMVPRNLSQAPIYQGEEFVGLLTTDTIARWLASNIVPILESDVCGESVGEIYEVYTENKNNHAFLHLDDTIIDVLGLFEEYEREGVRLEAILFTPDGSRSTNIQGIMNTWDIPKALKLVELVSIR